MSLMNLLLEKRSNILEQWCDIILRSYPEEAQSMLRKKKDQFGNPVGSTISEAMESIFDEFLHGTEPKNMSSFFDKIMRVRAIQDFSPSGAVAFVFGLKDVIREEVGSRLLENGYSEEWVTLESRIDGMALLCFDIYAQCRQKVFDIRVNEVRNRASKLLKMGGLGYDLPEVKGDPKQVQAN